MIDVLDLLPTIVKNKEMTERLFQFIFDAGYKDGHDDTKNGTYIENEPSTDDVDQVIELVSKFVRSNIY